MKIERHYVREMTIEAFAEENDLTMEINERNAIVDPSKRFYAKFKGAEISENHLLISTFGDGSNEEQAISNYACQISEKVLVFDAMKPQRRELRVPRLIFPKA